MSWRTRNGRPIEFGFQENDPEDERGVNKGYVVRRVDAYVDGIHAGYLKISYVPSKRVPECYPSVWHWLEAIKGWSLQLDDLSDTWAKCHNYAQRLPASLRGSGISVGSLSAHIPDAEIMREDLAVLEDTWIYGLWQSPREAFRTFINQSVDYAFVDYIRVFDGKSWCDAPAKINWQRQGIGTALYIEGARWLAHKFGLPMHASGLQSESAQAAWDSMRARGVPMLPIQRPDGKVIFALNGFNLPPPGVVRGTQEMVPCPSM